MRVLLILSSLVFVSASSVAAIAQSGSGQPVLQTRTAQRPIQTPTPSSSVIKSVSPASGDDGEVIKVKTQLVSIPVRVMDKSGRFIGGLGRENFRVFEGGVEQDLELFSNEHQPFTVALLIDMSNSTTFKIAEIQSAAIAFIQQLRPQDKVMVVSFDGDVHMLCEATNDREAISRAIKSTKVSDGTSLYEAVDLVMNNRLRRIAGRKAMILFTDGVDTTSRRTTGQDNLADAMELDALIYPIRYDTFADVQNMRASGVPRPSPIMTPLPGRPHRPQSDGLPSSQGTTESEYKTASEYLDSLAARTGGRAYEATTVGNLAEAYGRIASELREFYSIGYYPKDDRVPGKNTYVKVRVDREGLVVRSREGFLRRTPDR
ncbi:MAG: VWA domain-containing protein [Pyrinomonadaceae bacterium]